MKSQLFRVAFASVLLLTAIPGRAAGKAEKPGPVGEATATAPSKSPGRSTYPFRGEVESVEADHLLLARKEGTRRVAIGADSLFERDGKAIASNEVKPGDYVKGLLRKETGGSEVVVKATAGVRPEKGSKKGRKDR